MLDFASNLCLPAMVYLIMVIIGVVVSIILSFFYSRYITLNAIFCFMIGIFIKLLWVWLLNFICTKNHEGLSWFLFFLPYIVVVIIMYSFKDIFDKVYNKSNMQKIKN
jgi:hypothetical protein